MSDGPLRDVRLHLVVRALWQGTMNKDSTFLREETARRCNAKEWAESLTVQELNGLLDDRERLNALGGHSTEAVVREWRNRTVQRMRPKSSLRRLIERDGLKCHWCRKMCDPTKSPHADLYPTREHLVRKSDGGSSRMSNMVVSCRRCNNERHRPNEKDMRHRPAPVPPEPN